jgi:hypothetical protein
LALLRLETVEPAIGGEAELLAGSSRIRPAMPGWMRLPG